MLIKRGKDEISAKDALQGEAAQDRNASALRALQENAQRALSLSLAARFAKDAERTDISSVENALLETLEMAMAMATLVDAGRGGRTDYAEAIRALTERLKRDVEKPNL